MGANHLFFGYPECSLQMAWSQLMFPLRIGFSVILHEYPIRCPTSSDFRRSSVALPHPGVQFKLIFDGVPDSQYQSRIGNEYRPCSTVLILCGSTLPSPSDFRGTRRNRHWPFGASTLSCMPLFFYSLRLCIGLFCISSLCLRSDSYHAIIFTLYRRSNVWIQDNTSY